MIPVHIDDQGDAVCEHGTAMDVHCCNCHTGFIFDIDHECPPIDEPNWDQILGSGWDKTEEEA